MQTPLATKDTEAASKLRNALIDTLTQRGTIRTPHIEAAFRAVPRHLFLPGVALDTVYQDAPIITKRSGDEPISSSSQPNVMAAMLEDLDVHPGQRILEIGAGTGYNAALLAYLAGPTGQITTVDLDQDIVDAAQTHLITAGFGHVQVLRGDGWLGCAANAPYDRIIVTVGANAIAPAWWEQLLDGGRLVLPLNLFPHHLQPAFPYSALLAFEKKADHLASISVDNCGFMPLRGMSARTFPALVALPNEVLLAVADEQQIDGAALAHAVSGVGTDTATNIQLTPGEFLGLACWVGLRDSNACIWCEAEMFSVLESLEATKHTTVGSVSARSVGILLAVSNNTTADDHRLHVMIRSFGTDPTIVPRLSDHIHTWHRVGRPFMYGSFATATRPLRIYAYPLPTSDMPAASELVVQKESTQLLFAFR